MTVEILRSGVTQGPCTLILKYFEQPIALPGTFAHGEYSLRVNAFSRTFRVD